MLYTHPPASASTVVPASPCAWPGRSSAKTTCPGQWAQFTGENAKFSGQLGSPGGAAKTGPLPHDTDHVASYVTSR
jgi:hypothetical protein